jgi:SAM-dependent methyltransferase
MPDNKECPLSFSKSQPIEAIKFREYFLCTVCSLVFADSRFFIGHNEEKARYFTHNNTLDNEGYIIFLNRIIEPSLPLLRPEMNILDYGCGHNPVLAELIKLKGFKCDFYDPFFFDNELKPPFDFIFSTEVFEHFNNPASDIEKISSLLIQGGYLAIMTELWQEPEQLLSWYYMKDVTHVSFYHQKTLDYICEKWGYEPIYNDTKRVFIFRKK